LEKFAMCNNVLNTSKKKEEKDFNSCTYFAKSELVWNSWWSKHFESRLLIDVNIALCCDKAC